ncbi:MAG: HEAT repeat domain-containing protein [Candidatus Latescibacterota bacterium]
MTAHAAHAVPALTTLMGDESEQVRFDATYGLAHHREAAAPATDALVAALDDDNHYVRNHSTEALKSIVTPAATAALFDFLAVSRWCPITSKESTF